MKPACLKSPHAVNHYAMKLLRSRLEDYPTIKEPLKTLNLRLAEYSDLEAMVALEERGYQGYVAWSLEDFQRDWRLNRHAVYFVLEDPVSKAIIGMVTGRFVEGHSHISHLLVDPAWQGQNLGTYLLEVWLRASYDLGKEFVDLEVRERNFRAQKLYYRYGFKQVGRREFYYEESGETALLLKCSLREGPFFWW